MSEMETEARLMRHFMDECWWCGIFAFGGVEWLLCSKGKKLFRDHVDFLVTRETKPGDLDVVGGRDA